MAISKAELVDRLSDLDVELKSVDIASGLSEETLAYTATVYVGGEIVGSAKNRGRGGQTMLQGFHDGRSGDVKRNIDKLRNAVADLPEVQTRYGKMKYDAEMVVDFLASHDDFMGTIKRHIRDGKIVFRLSDQDYGEFSYVGYNGNESGAADKIREKYDVDKVYNDA